MSDKYIFILLTIQSCTVLEDFHVRGLLVYQCALSFSFTTNKVDHIFHLDLFLWFIYILLPSADGEGGLEDESRSVSGFLHFDTASKGNHNDCWLYISEVYQLLNRQESHLQKGYFGKKSSRCSKHHQYMKQFYLVWGEKIN